MNVYPQLIVLLSGLALAVPPTAEESLKKGKEALQSFKEAEARDLFTESIRLDPKNPETYYYRGLAYQGLLEPDKAVADHTMAIKLNPKFVDAFVARGTAHYINSDHTKAIADFSEAIILDPKNVAVFSKRGLVHAGNQDYTKAIADYLQVIKLDPENTNAYADIGKILATCPDDKIRDGKRALEYAIKANKLTDGTNWATLEVLAASYAELGKFENAIQAQKKAIEVVPEKSEIIRKAALGRLKQYEDKKPLRYKTLSEW
jgi:tetratricopeptide (TPR) repeat protein